MSQVITAPHSERALFPSVFLAGGITNCKNWQKDVITELESEEITIYNPRRESFDITDASATDTQITWEYERLEQMDIFSMFFVQENQTNLFVCMNLGVISWGCKIDSHLIGKKELSLMWNMVIKEQKM